MSTISPATTPAAGDPAGRVLALRHRFVPGTEASAAPLLLLHGTGGDEDDLLPLGQSLSPGAALLSPRGAVMENGMPRFFRRLAAGVFDEADLGRRAAELAAFVGGARAAYGVPAPVAVGFSNGANIAAAVLLLHPGVLAGAVLLRAMPPLAAAPTLAGPPTPVLMLSGAHDPIVPGALADRLAGDLARAGARVAHRTLPGGHGLGAADVRVASAWLLEEELR